MLRCTRHPPYGIAEEQDFLTEGKGDEFRDLFGIRMALDPKILGGLKMMCIFHTGPVKRTRQ